MRTVNNLFYVWKLSTGKQKTVCFYCGTFLRFCVIQLKSHNKLNFIGMWFADKYTQCTASSGREHQNNGLMFGIRKKVAFAFDAYVYVCANGVRQTIYMAFVDTNAFVPVSVWSFLPLFHSIIVRTLRTHNTHLSKSTTLPCETKTGLEPILPSLPSQKSIKSGIEWTTKMEGILRKNWEKIANFVEFPFGFQIFRLFFELFPNRPASVVLDRKKVNNSTKILILADIFGVL